MEAVIDSSRSVYIAATGQSNCIMKCVPLQFHSGLDTANTLLAEPETILIACRYFVLRVEENIGDNLSFPRVIRSCICTDILLTAEFSRFT